MTDITWGPIYGRCTLTAAEFSEVSWTFLGANLWLSEADTIRRNKAFEVGRCGVSQQLHWLCPHSLNFMVGWDDRKNQEGPESGRERKRDWDRKTASVSRILKMAKNQN